MKKLNILFIGLLSMSTVYAQDISDALRYSQSEIQGTARFRALSGAFGALGGDMSAVSANPAGSAVFSRSHASFTGSNVDVDNDTQYFNGLNNSGDSSFDINQGGAVFVFASKNNSPWRKFTLGIAYDKTNNHDDNWKANGTNVNSIDSYFFQQTQGTELSVFTPSNSELSQYFGINESNIENDFSLYVDLAYQFLGEVESLQQQQNFLGFSSGLIEPDDVTNNNNTNYTSNLGDGTFTQNYDYLATGYNGKISFNAATQYEDDLYLGINLNSHFIDYQRSTFLIENNNNPASLINRIQFENTLSTTGSGFSFQLGGIMKLSPEFRAGVTYDSPTWYTIKEETTQGIATSTGTDIPSRINPQIVNIYPEYKLQTPAKITGSLAYVFAKKGLISFDYSKKNYGNTKFKPESDYTDLNAGISDVLTDASTYRIGGEYRHKQISFRGGYRFEESPYADGVTVGDLTGYSLGLGFNFGNTKLDVTYDQSERSFATPLYNIGLIDTAAIDRTNSNITLSLSFNL